MKTRLVSVLSGLFLTTTLVFLFSGCAWSVGGSKCNTSSHTPTQSPTQGQELIDLQKARDQGAISDAEYERMKQRILNTDSAHP